jgi:hypothetical protein
MNDEAKGCNAVQEKELTNMVDAIWASLKEQNHKLIGINASLNRIERPTQTKDEEQPIPVEKEPETIMEKLHYCHNKARENVMFSNDMYEKLNKLV